MCLNPWRSTLSMKKGAKLLEIRSPTTLSLQRGCGYNENKRSQRAGNAQTEGQRRGGVEEEGRKGRREEEERRGRGGEEGKERRRGSDATRRASRCAYIGRSGSSLDQHLHSPSSSSLKRAISQADIHLHGICICGLSRLDLVRGICTVCCHHQWTLSEKTY